jgi:IclR family KDG regulon transcriptional repressor
MLIQSIQRAAEILDIIAEEERVGVRALAKRLRLSKSTVHNLLTTLEAVGYICQSPSDRCYYLSMKLFELGSVVVNRSRLRDQVRPYLEQLAAQTKETVYLGVIDRGDVIYIDKIDTPHVLGMLTRVGERAPVHCTGIGKALLAYGLLDLGAITEIKAYTRRTITSIEALKEHLATIRVRGFAVDDEEFINGVRSVAAPLWVHHKQVVAGISVAGPVTRMTYERVEMYGRLVARMAMEISRSLGYRYDG